MKIHALRCCSLLFALAAGSQYATAFGFDQFEPNDTCATATVLSYGEYDALDVVGPPPGAPQDPDNFRVTVPAGETLHASIFFSSFDGDLDLYLLTTDSSLCGGPNASGTLAFSQSATDNESVSWSNNSSQHVDVIVHVEAWTSSGQDTFGTCVYELWLNDGDPCDDDEDAFEPNDSCSNATPVPAWGGTFTDMHHTRPAADVFEITLNPGATLDVVVTDTIWLFYANLYSESQVAQGACSGQGLPGIPLLTANGTSPFSLSYTHNGSTPESFFVYLNQETFPPLDPGDPWCGSYEIEFLVTGDVLAAEAVCLGDGTDAGAGAISPCPCNNGPWPLSGEGCVNSTGVGARLTATGTTNVANDDLVFHATQASANEPSVLLMGHTATSLPFRDGVLCAGNPTTRVEWMPLDAAGAASTSTSIVSAGGVPGPGVTRYYQLYYRDPVNSPCGTGSNFTNALRVAWL